MYGRQTWLFIICDGYTHIQDMTNQKWTSLKGQILWVIV